MATDQQIDPTEETTQVPPPSETTEPQEATPSVEELQEKLAAAESEAKTWKGRAEKATKDKPVPVSEADLDWKILNANRIALVKQQYDKELSDLEAEGVKLSNSLREKALKLAEATVGIKKPASDEPLPAPSVDRTSKQKVELNAYDQAFGVKQETKEKFREYVEG